MSACAKRENVCQLCFADEEEEEEEEEMKEKRKSLKKSVPSQSTHMALYQNEKKTNRMWHEN